jgi:hypothetical protein
LLLLDHPFAFQLHLEEFSLTVINFVSLLPFAVVVIVFFSDATLK